MKTINKIFAVILSIAMTCAMMPNAAFALNAGDNASFSVTSPTVEIDGTVAKTVDVSFCGTEQDTYLALEGTFATSATNNSIALTGMTASYTTDGMNSYVDVASGKFKYADTSMVGTEFSANAPIVTATYTVPADTAPGIYTVSVTLTDSMNSGYEQVTGVTYTATITVTEPTVDGYTAGVSVTGSTVTVGNTVTVNVGVSHSEDVFYNAGEIILEYDSAYLTLDTSSLDGLQYTNENGVLTIEDFGADKSFGTSNYAVVFTTVQVGTTTVALTSAKFVHKDNADESDLIVATLSPASVEITINEVTYDVTLPTDGNITGNSVATKGEDYTFTVAEPDNYDYEITVTVGGEEINTVTGPDANGQYTIPNTSIDGDIVITYTRDGKPQEVEWTGDGIDAVTDKPTSATYGTDFVFTVPAEVDATAEVAGATYSATVSIAGSTYFVSAAAGETVNIPGTEIVGKITINVDYDELPANGVSVSISGEDVKFDDGTTNKVVTPGTVLNLVLSPEDGYNYSVKIGDTEIMNNGTTTYELTVTGATEIKVTKTLDVSTVAVTNYIQVNSYVVWLVTYDGSLAAGKVPTYDGKTMYWSDKYDAYCWLVIESALTADTAKTKVNAATGTKVSVDYGMDINGTTVTDAADAQLVWNMYNALYSDFTSVSMAQFLAADQNATSSGNWGLNVQDAQVIITAILSGNATT